MNLGGTERGRTEVITKRMDAGHDIIETFSYLLACAIALAIAAIFSFAMMKETGKVPVVRLQTRINPNDAPAASLIRLPQIGMTRAEKIVAYRQVHVGDNSVFTCTKDLQKVKGIGSAIAGRLDGYLRFD